MLRLLLVLVAIVVGCASETAPSESPSALVAAIPVSTSEPLTGPGPHACPAALLEGRLVQHEQWGIAVLAGDEVVKVYWPHGYTARDVGDRLALLNEHGQTIAMTGELLGIGGGQSFQGDGFYACGGYQHPTEGPG